MNVRVVLEQDWEGRTILVSIPDDLLAMHPDPAKFISEELQLPIHAALEDMGRVVDGKWKGQ